MSKRFTDTEKWSRMNFRKMSPATKLFWIYILDRCDHAGVWCVDLEAAEFFIGMKLDEKKLLGEMNGNVVVLNEGKKWFVVDFIRFQYGDTLNPNNKLHNSVINLLKTYGIDYENIELLKQAPIKPLDSPYLGVKDKDKEKDKDKNKEKEEEKPVKNPDGWNEKWEALWNEWVEYKKVQHKFVYKNISGTKKALMTNSDNNLSVATEMVNQAIMSGWTGVYNSNKKEEKKSTYAPKLPML